MLPSSLFIGQLLHTRRGAVRNTFVYPTFALLLNLAELPTLPARLRLLGYNRPNLLAVYDADHRVGDARLLPAGLNFAPLPTESVQDRLMRYLAAHDIPPPSALYLLTYPRVCGYGFNPVSFYYALNAQGEVLFVVAEVGNTYGDQHPYLLNAACALPARAGEHRYWADKRFYVSPFIGPTARYEFTFSALSQTLAVQIDEWQAGEHFFRARLWGDLQPLTLRGLLGTLVRFPFHPLQVFGLIHWQALKLLARRVPAQPYPY